MDRQTGKERGRGRVNERDIYMDRQTGKERGRVRVNERETDRWIDRQGKREGE